MQKPMPKKCWKNTVKIYNIYKRLAFLEIDKQEQKQNRQRDYRSFEEYYEKAKSVPGRAKRERCRQ